MKKATKILLIISIVSYAILVLCSAILIISGTALLVIGNDAEYTFQSIYFIAMGITYFISAAVGIPLGAVALKKIGKATRASDISTAFKVCVLIFANAPAGIIMLCMKDEHFAPPVTF